MVGVDAGVVEQHVGGAQLGGRAPDDPPDVVAAAHAGADRDGFAARVADPADHVLDRSLLQIHGGDLRPLLREEQGGGLADAAGGAGDNGDLMGEPHRGLPFGPRAGGGIGATSSVSG